MKSDKTARSVFLILFLVASVLGATPRPTQAASIPYVEVTAVDNNVADGTCSLRRAIIAINQGADPTGSCKIDSTTTTIILPNQEVTLTVKNDFDLSGTKIIESPAAGDLDIRKSMKIRGSGKDSKIVWIGKQAGNTLDRVFHIYPGVSVVMENFSIGYGTAQNEDPKYGDGGGILNDGGNLTLANMTLDHNSAAGAGGAVASKPNSTLLVINSTFSSNAAVVSGGGINNESKAQIQTSLFEGNYTYGAQQGAAFYNSAPPDTLILVNSSTFYNNLGNVVENSGTLALNFVTIFKNNGYETGNQVNNLVYGIYGNVDSWTMMRGSVLGYSTGVGLNGKDCYRIDTSAKFVDGGYNLLSPGPQAPDNNLCPFNFGQPYNTQALYPLALNFDPQSKMFTFRPEDQLPVYDGIPASGGVCLFPDVPNVPTGIIIPPAPGYDQLGRARPDIVADKPDHKCDIGSFEFGAAISFTAMPAVFNR